MAVPLPAPAPGPRPAPAPGSLPAPALLPDRSDLERYAAAVCALAREALPGAVSVIWKGSAFKRWEGPYDFLPGLSDLDVHVYRPGGLGDPWALREVLADRLGPPPGRVPFQLLVLDPAELPAWWTVLPGTYRVLAGGAPPCPVPPRPVLVERDRISLAEASGHAGRVAAGVVSRSDDELWNYLVANRWMFGPVLHRVVSVAIGRPEQVWALNRTRVITMAAAIPSLDAVLRAALAYFEAARVAGLARPDSSPAPTAVRRGRELLLAAAAWAAGRPDALPERRAPGWWREA